MTRNRDTSGFGLRRHEALHRGLVVVDEAVRRLAPSSPCGGPSGSSPARASARAFSMTWSGACTHTCPSGSKPGRPARPASWWNSRTREAAHPGAVELRERGHQHGADRDVDADAERVGAADHRQQALRRRAARRGGGSAAACRRGARRRRCGRAGRACRRSRGPSGRSAIAAAIASRCGRVVTLRLTRPWARSIAAAWLACTTYTGLSPSPTASRTLSATGVVRHWWYSGVGRSHRRHLGDRAGPTARARSVVIALMSPSVADASSIWQLVSSSSGTCHAHPRSPSP